MSGAKGDGVVEDWTWETIRVEGNSQSERSIYSYTTGILIDARAFQFAYHVFLLRDTLGELTAWEEIAAVQQVLILYSQPSLWADECFQLLTALDGVSLEETGTLINTIVCFLLFPRTMVTDTALDSD